MLRKSSRVLRVPKSFYGWINAFAHSLILAVSMGTLSHAWFIDRKGLATAITYCGMWLGKGFCSSSCISAAPKKRIIKKFPTGNFFIIYVYSTVTDFARLRGLSTSHPLQTAV